MSILPQRIFTVCYLLLYAATIAIVLMTEYSDAHKQLLYRATKENSFYELGSVVALFAIAATSLNMALAPAFKEQRAARTGLMILSAVAVLAAMEEISWGQHFFGFQAGDAFQKYNRQGETNLHNFIHPVAFALTQNLCVYLVFIYLPIFLRLRPQHRHKTLMSIPVHVLLPSIQNTLIFCYAMSFQAYFLLDTYSDTALLAVAMAGVFVCMRKGNANRWCYFHWGLVVLSAGVYMLCHNVLRFENMQYEIREMIICLGICVWLVESFQRFKAYETATTAQAN